MEVWEGSCFAAATIDDEGWADLVFRGALDFRIIVISGIGELVDVAVCSFVTMDGVLAVGSFEPEGRALAMSGTLGTSLEVNEGVLATEGRSCTDVGEVVRSFLLPEPDLVVLAFVSATSTLLGIVRQ